jgi:hypothetical protein
VLTTYKVAAFGDEIIFPFLLPNGELAMAKARKAEDGASPKPTAANCEPILFGWQAVPAGCSRDHHHRGRDRRAELGSLRLRRHVGAVRRRQGRQAEMDRKRIRPARAV